MRDAISILVAVAAVTGGLVIYQWRGPTANSTARTTAGGPALESVTAPVRIAVQFVGGKVTTPSTARIKQDDVVVLTLKSDQADELHLHGYDLRMPVRPDEPATLEFVAERTGRFTYELHHADVELGAIEVYPR